MIYITAIKEFNKQKNKVCLSDGTDFVLYKKEVRQYGLKEEHDISDELYARMLEEVFVPRAKRRAMHLLERMDRSQMQLRGKLKDAGYPQEAIDAAISYVESYHYIDDERLARSYIRFYQDSRSKMRITQDLMKKGIARDLIAYCLEEEYQNAELELIRNLLQKKHYDSATATREEKAKMYRFLMGRGYRSNDISRALGESWDD